MKNQERRNYNRAVVMLILGIFVSLWVMANAQAWITSALLYITIGIICIFFYWAFPKFSGWS